MATTYENAMDFPARLQGQTFTILEACAIQKIFDSFPTTDIRLAWRDVRTKQRVAIGYS